MVVLTVVLTAIIGAVVLAAARASYERTHALAAPRTLDVLRLAPSAVYFGEGVGSDVPTASPPAALPTPEPTTPTTPTPVTTSTPTPAPAPQATVYAAAVPGNAEGWLAAADVPPSLRPAFAAIGACESHHNPAAVGDSGNSLGWLQINWRTWFPYALSRGLVSAEDKDRWDDPVVNARVGYSVVLYSIDRGQAPFSQWTCQP